MKCAGEKFRQKVKENDNEQYVRTPVMYVSDELTKENIVLQVNDRLVGAVGNWLVDKFQHQTRCNMYISTTAIPPRPHVSGTERALLDASGAKVKNQAVEKVSITLTRLGLCSAPGKIE